MLLFAIDFASGPRILHHSLPGNLVYELVVGTSTAITLTLVKHNLSLRSHATANLFAFPSPLPAEKRWWTNSVYNTSPLTVQGPLSY